MPLRFYTEQCRNIYRNRKTINVFDRAAKKTFNFDSKENPEKS